MEEKTIKQEGAKENGKEADWVSPLKEVKQRKKRLGLSFVQLVVIACVAAFITLAMWSVYKIAYTQISGITVPICRR